MATKTIELTKPFGLHIRGAILSLDSPVADLLIARGAAVLLETPAVGSGLPVGEPDAATLSRRQAKLQAHGRKP